MRNSRPAHTESLTEKQHFNMPWADLKIGTSDSAQTADINHWFRYQDVPVIVHILTMEPKIIVDTGFG